MSFPKRKNSIHSSNVDVAIIGAGLAGLAAAQILQAAKVNVQIVEARDRVGGRVLSYQVKPDAWVDLGAQWVGANQPYLLQLADKYNLDLIPQHYEGKHLLYLDSTLHAYRDQFFSHSFLHLTELNQLITKIQRASKHTYSSQFFSTPKALLWDSMTLETWKRTQLQHPRERALFDTFVKSLFAADPMELSFLYFITSLQSDGGFLNASKTLGGAQQSRFKGGCQVLPQVMAKQLLNPIWFKSPARLIKQEASSISIFGDHYQIQAKQVIIALAPSLAARIEYQPALPWAREQLHQRMPMGSVIKIVTLYPTAFWRDAGFSGEVLSNQGPIRLVYDVSIPSKQSSHASHSPENHEFGGLVSFILGSDVIAFGLQTPEQRKNTVLFTLTQFFGPQAEHPIEYIEKDWTTEPWSHGCYSGLMAPGLLTRYQSALRQPVGRIHWAGTETAEHWNGYMEGALESGERAAKEVLARLQATE